MSERAIRRQHERDARRGRAGRRRARVVAGLAAGATVLAAPAAANAATFEVTQTTDGPVTLPCDATCNLRDAVAAANANAGADTIVFQSGLSGTITLTDPAGAIGFTDAAMTTLDGPVDESISVDGDQSDRVFYALGSATINDLAIQDGFATGGPPFGSGVLAYGGAANLTLDSVLVRSNGTKYSVGGGVAAYGPDAANTPELTIVDSLITGNTAAVGGGVIAKYADVTMADTTVRANGGNNATFAGGGISAGKYSTLDAENLTVRGNTSGYFGGGLAASYGAEISVTGSTISNNSAAAAGGGIGYIGQIGGTGGSLDVETSTIAGNYGSLGGGVLLAGLTAGGSISLDRSTISGNAAAGGGDSIGYAGLGGGLAILNEIAGPLSVRNSTVSGNDAIHGGGISFGFSAETTIRRRAKMDKVANELGVGSQGIVQPGEPTLLPGGSFGFNSLTVGDNAASEAGGGIYLGIQYDGTDPYNETVPLTNTIVAGNQVGATGNDLHEAAAPGGGFRLAYSLVQNRGNATVTQVPAGRSLLGVDPLLGSLSNNGGPTKTMAPPVSSPAINAGGTALTIDQRGRPRPAAPLKDMGAVELQVGSASITSGPSGVIRDATPTFSFTGSPASFQCSVDGGAFAACTSPFTTPELSDGPHTFAVRSVGSEGPGPAAEQSFTVDTKVKGAKIKLKKKQKAKNGKAVVKIKAGAGEPVQGTASGKLGKFKLKKQSKSTAAGKLSTYKLKPTGKNKKKAAKALANGKVLKGKLKVKLTDGAGNTKTLKGKTKLK